jgi:L-seryl-tRNA(Ser) seleniumtransferase
MADRTLTRRKLLRRSAEAGALLALPSMVPARAEAAQSKPAAKPSAPAAAAKPADAPLDVYGAIGVRPLVNARGTFTVISGSTLLPEVRAAIDAASRRYVQLDELNEAIGARLAQLTKAEWGLVTSGCSAAITHATAACIAGGNPDLHVRIPNLQGFAKDEVVIPAHSRNVYDAAVRTTGVRILAPATMAEFEAALGPRTAMIYLFAGPAADASPLNLKAIAPIAKARGVPIFVDAAAEILTIPNVHLEAGATLVGYSGGKCLRGPQSAGLLLGRKDLVKAAWVHSAPHHGPHRGYKVGKEEAIGMLAAVEAWVKRDHDGEFKRWSGWLDHISAKVKTVDGVTTEVVQPDSLSNRMPTLRVRWSRNKLGVTGDVVMKTLYDGEPRIALAGGGGGGDADTTGLTVAPYMMHPGDEVIVADALYAILSKPPKTAMVMPAEPAGDVSGGWDVKIQYAASTSTHTFQLRQKGAAIEGAHKGDFVTRDVAGTMEGDTVRLRSNVSEEGGDALGYTFTGKLAGDQLSGALDMGEYLTATWTASRRTGGRRRG